MSWLVRMLGIEKARAAFARLAAVVNLFTDDVEESLRRLRGKAGVCGIRNSHGNRP